MKTIMLNCVSVLLVFILSSVAFAFGDGSSLEMLPGTSYTVDGNATTGLISPENPEELAQFTACLISYTYPGQGATLEELQQYLNNISGCLQEFSEMPQGSFAIVIRFTTTETVPDQVTIPAGSVFTPGSDESQPMMTIDTLYITVPANGTISVTLPVFCLAPSKDAPSAEDTYSYSGVATKACLVQIMDILETKDIDTFSYQEIGIVQDAIWNCVTDSFSQSDIDNLNALPEAETEKNNVIIPTIFSILLE